MRLPLAGCGSNGLTIRTASRHRLSRKKANPAGGNPTSRSGGKDFLYGEDVTIAEWTISTEGLPLYGS
ncbi:hypothetical protein [Streptomyces sp. NBC_00582]|uniref:hypothetical protein n=1 Tax=Streptomyces sp. NBC_00582 TaxID=2975783 RepID=UPI003FCDB0EF